MAPLRRAFISPDTSSPPRNALAVRPAAGRLVHPVHRRDVGLETIRYYRNHWAALFRFVDHPEIPIDNSASEREYQQVAKMRLNSLFCGSTEGAHRAATLLGIVATCRALGVYPLGYLGWSFTRLGTHRDVYGLSAAEITPAAYAKAHPVA